MTVEYRTGGEAPAPVKLTYQFDGSVSKNMMAGRGGGAPTEQVSKTMWAGNNLVVTTTTGAGDGSARSRWTATISSSKPRRQRATAEPRTPPR